LFIPAGMRGFSLGVFHQISSKVTDVPPGCLRIGVTSIEPAIAALLSTFMYANFIANVTATIYPAVTTINTLFGFLSPHQKCIEIWGGSPLSAIFTLKKALSKNDRYYAVVDRRSNMTVMKLCYHANLCFGFANEHRHLYRTILVHVVISQLHVSKPCVTIHQRIIISYDHPTFQVSNVCDKLADSNRL